MRLCSALLLLAALALPIPTLAVTLIGTQPTQGVDTTILQIETEPFSSTPIGLAGVPSLSGLDFQPGTGVLFASAGGGSAGNLYTVNIATGAATLVGATGFPKVPGLVFDVNGTLYGSADVTGNNNASDGLIEIDPVTGAGTLIGVYGSIGPDTIGGVDSLAIHPITGVLYGMGGFHDSLGNFTGGDSVFQIDRQTGAATQIELLGASANMVTGLSFDPTGRLFSSNGAGDGQIGEIDLDIPSFTILGDAADGSVSDIAVLPEPAGAAAAALLALGTLVGLRRRRRRSAAVGGGAPLDLRPAAERW